MIHQWAICAGSCIISYRVQFACVVQVVFTGLLKACWHERFIFLCIWVQKQQHWNLTITVDCPPAPGLCVLLIFHLYHMTSIQSETVAWCSTNITITYTWLAKWDNLIGDNGRVLALGMICLGFQSCKSQWNVFCHNASKWLNLSQLR